MKKQLIYDTIKNEGFSEIDQIDFNKDTVVYNFFYDFDEDEIEAAKDYSNENNSEENDEDEWYNEYFLPYLTDIAGDNVRDVMDDIIEDMELTGEFIVYELERENYMKCEITLVLANEGTEINMDKILEELDL